MNAEKKQPAMLERICQHENPSRMCCLSCVLHPALIPKAPPVARPLLLRQLKIWEVLLPESDSEEEAPPDTAPVAAPTQPTNLTEAELHFMDEEIF